MSDFNPKIKYPLPSSVERNTFKVQQTARWFKIGASPSEADHVVIVLHGYGQHPAFMLDGFMDLINDPGISICAPEALSRFYVRGTEGRVGASWMTRDDRLSDISDHLAYLNSWLNSLSISPKAQLTLIGFSQGVATAGRWLASGLNIHQALLHSGTVPVEWHSTDTTEAPQFSKSIERFVLFRGDSDSIYSEENHIQAATFLKECGYKVETVEYEGGHKMLVTHFAPYL